MGLAELPLAAGVGLAGGLLAVQGVGAATGTLHDLAPGRVARLAAEQQAQLETIAILERDGPRRLYAETPGGGIRTFLSQQRVIVSHPTLEGYPPYALAVDGAGAVGWWRRGLPTAFEANLATLDVRFAFRRLGPLGGAYVDFALAPQGLRELDPGTLTVTASANAWDAGAMLDREAATHWSSGQPMRGAEWFQVDLGRVEPVALIRWVPRFYREVPAGLRLEASLDGGTWQRLIELPRYTGPLYWSAGHPMKRARSGRVELRVTPTPARYLRVTQTGEDLAWYWTVRELFVYAEEPGAPPVPPELEGTALARAVRTSGVTRFYADHGWATRVTLADPEIHVTPANLALDAYDFRGPESELLPRMRWSPGSGALVEAPDVFGFVRVAWASGLAFERVDLGGLTLFAYAPPPRLGSPIPRSALRASTSHDSKRARRTIDGDPRSRWTTGRPQAPGDWLRVDLATPRAIRAVRLSTRVATDWPRGLRLDGSDDGETWRALTTEVRTENAVRWAGVTLLRDEVLALRLEFAPMTLRALRVVLTRGDSHDAWSVNELTVHAAD